jgi:hypothetical protein
MMKTRQIQWTAFLRIGNSIFVCTLAMTLMAAGVMANRLSGPATEGESLSITAVSPDSGPVNGGTPIRITGTDFSNGATVTLGGVAALDVVRVEDNLITAVTPSAGAPGSANVVVSVPNGKSTTLSGGFAYTTHTPPAPTTSAQFIPFVVDNDDFRSNLILTNKSSSPANVTVSFIDGSGTVIASKTYTIPPNGRIQQGNVLRDLLESTIPTGKIGYLAIESDQSLSVATTPIDNSTNSSSVVQGSRGRGHRLLLPTSTSIGSFKTTLTVVNDDSAQNEVEIRLRGDDGSSRAIKKVTLAGYGFFHTEDLHAFLGVTGAVGAVELSATGSNPRKFVAVSKVYAPLVTQSGNSGTVSSFFTAEPFD